MSIEKLLWDMLDEDKEKRIMAGQAIWDMHQEKYYDLEVFHSEVRLTVDNMREQRPNFIRTLLQSYLTPYYWQDMPGNSRMGRFVVFDSLDIAFMDAPDLVEKLVQTQQMFSVLQRIGPPAKQFIPYLLKNARNTEGAFALSSIIRDDKEEIERMLSWLESSDDFVTYFAMTTFKYLGADVKKQIPDVLDRLKKVISKNPCGMMALASVGRNDAESLDIILAFMPEFPGVVIDCLSYFTDFPEKVVPILIAALDTFEEYDPDWEYDGSYGRIVSALTDFGDKGAEAVDPLLAILIREADEEDTVFNTPLIRCLGNMGPAARATLPYLENLCEMEKEDPEDYCPDVEHIATAVARIRGKPGLRDSWKVQAL
jgi:hypothetical protein